MRSLRGQLPPSPAIRVTRAVIASSSVSGVVLAMCQNMSSGYREPSTTIASTNSRDSGALLVARATE